MEELVLQISFIIMSTLLTIFVLIVITQKCLFILRNSKSLLEKVGILIGMT